MARVPVKALVFGTEPDRWDTSEGATGLLANLAVTPVALREIPDARPLRPDWVVTQPRLAGICGTDSKQVLLEFGEGDSDSALSGLASFPQVLGHEAVAEVVELGPEAVGVEVGQRVVLDPWLTCVPRGVSEICPACVGGDTSLCHSFAEGAISVGLHTGVSADATGAFAGLMPAHPQMLHPVPDDVSDEQAVLADPFSVSLHSVTRHPPPAAGRVLVWGGGALGSSAIAILRALHPDVEVGVVARFDAQADLASKLGAARVFRLSPPAELLEEIARWSGGRIRPLMDGLDGLPMCHPGGIDVIYDTIGKPETLELGARVLKARGTLVQSGVATPGRWESSPLYFKEISLVGSNAFGIEEVEGMRRHAIDHYLDMVIAGRVDLTAMITHRFPLTRWRDAFAMLADQASSGAIKVTFDPQS